MEEAPRYKLLTLFIWFTMLTLFTLLKLLYTAKTLAYTSIYIFRKGLIRFEKVTGGESRICFKFPLS